MLKNAYLLAKIGADTAENERNFAENLPKIGNYPTGPLPYGRRRRGARACRRTSRESAARRHRLFEIYELEAERSKYATLIPLIHKKTGKKTGK